VAAQNLAVKAVVAPVLIGGASLAGRRFGHQVGGWLVGLPMTSGPVAFFLATDKGVHFAAALATGYLIASRRPPGDLTEPAQPPRWDIPVRMLAATTVVLLITTLAPTLGPHLAGLLSPFPVLGAVLAVFTHQSHGAAAGMKVLDGLLRGLLAPAVFFLALALLLPDAGLPAFAIATAAALATQAISMLAVPRDDQPASG
jgi:hypothetical protein